MDTATTTTTSTATTIWSEDTEQEKQYTMIEFLQYISTDLSFVSSDPQNHYVFWVRGDDDGGGGHTLQNRIKQGLQNVNYYLWDSTLIQFWEPRASPNGGRRFLSTSRQPFALKKLYKGLSWYRKQCSNHDAVVLPEDDRQLMGPLGRVFTTGQPESSPDMRCYSVREYPLRDHALRCGLRRYMALPLFELHNDQCLGVLELVSFNTALPLTYFSLCRYIGQAFQKYNLRVLLHTEGQPDSQTEGQKLAMYEIKQMLKVVNETPNIPLALAWVPCRGCSGNCSSMELALFECDQEWNKQYELINSDFVDASVFHKLHESKGVAGRALSSIHKLCFCRSIDGFNIAEYPLAHYATKAMLTVSLAICLCSTHTGSDPYVLEFFMRPGSQDDEADPQSLIKSLLLRMKLLLLSFKVANGQQLGEELLVEIVRFRMEDEPVYFGKSSSDRCPLAFKVSQVEQRSPSDRNLQLEAAEPAMARNNSTLNLSLAEEPTLLPAASSHGKRRGTSFNISYEDLEAQFGRPRKLAANSLGVSESTLKRAIKNHDITRWPYHPKNKANPSLCAVKPVAGQQDPAGSSQVDQPSSSNLSTATQQLDSRNTNQRADTTSQLLTIRASYESKTVKFRLCMSSGMAKLEQELAKRLKLKIGELEISYQDEEGCPIHLTCDEDFDFCVHTFSELGRSTVQLSVHAVGAC